MNLILLSVFIDDSFRPCSRVLMLSERALLYLERKAEIERASVVISDYFFDHLATSPAESVRTSHDGMNPGNTSLGSM